MLSLVREGFSTPCSNAFSSFVFTLIPQLSPVSPRHLSTPNLFPWSFPLALPTSPSRSRSQATSRLKEWWGQPKGLVWAGFKPWATKSLCLTPSFRKILNSLIFFWGAGVLSQSETVLSPKEAWLPFSGVCSYHLHLSSCLIGQTAIFFLVPVDEEPDLICITAPWLCQGALGSIQPRAEEKCDHSFGSSTVPDWFKLII